MKEDRAFVCPNGAKVVCDREVSVNHVVHEVLRDEVFYRNSGGGVTLSGGEPLMQDAFCLELLKRFKHHDLHTAVETCGFVSRSRLAAIAEYTDLFLFDCKKTDPEMHKRFTGVDSAIILENVSLLNDLNKKTILRCPIVKGTE